MSKLIPLTRGLHAIVDDDDYEYLMQWNWYARITCGIAYASRSVRVNGKKRQVHMHREILGLTTTPPFVDHINHNGLDNRRCNLRSCTTTQNHCNRRQFKGSSQFKGVSLYRNGKAWRARISINGKQAHLGTFRSESEAAMAYENAAKKYHGDFALFAIRKGVSL